MIPIQNGPFWGKSFSPRKFLEEMTDIPADAPEHCPGTQSDSAGKSSACAGCPNQQICSSGSVREPDPAIEQIRFRLEGVRHKILVLSGKGGVGKSTVSALITRALACDKSMQVGLLDIDVCGPSIPRVFGVENEQVHQSGSGWCPIYADENIAVMSIGFLLSSLDDAVIWRGPKKNGIIKQFLRDVEWDELDYLVIDTPPGTSDEHLSIVQYLREAGIDGAIIVTTPQEVSLLDVRKEINFCRKVGISIIGVVENMRDFVCPKCHKTSTILPATSGGAEQMCRDMNVPFLASLPLNPVVAEACDRSCNIFDDDAVAQLIIADDADDGAENARDQPDRDQRRTLLESTVQQLRADYTKISNALIKSCENGLLDREIPPPPAKSG